jgi:hypothetical protein
LRLIKKACASLRLIRLASLRKLVVHQTCKLALHNTGTPAKACASFQLPVESQVISINVVSKLKDTTQY